MVQIPDSAKPYVEGFVKYHFWILAAIVPFVLVPSVFSANDSLHKRIVSQRSTIDGHASALRSIQGEPEHPNTKWVEAIDRRTKATRADILEQWQLFWDSQRFMREWPTELGNDFLVGIQAVEEGKRTRLPANLLQRYQNSVADIVRKLPARMGCKDLMFDGGSLALQPGADGMEIVDAADSPEASLRLDPLVWRAEDQRRILGAFTWHTEPSTTQVRLAQEELWVYGLLSDLISAANAGATGAFNATITTVDKLAIGYAAAEESPGGNGGQRIMWKGGPPGAPTGAEDGAPPPSGGPIQLSRPPNPRFGHPGSGVETTLVAPPPVPPPDAPPPSTGDEFVEEDVSPEALAKDEAMREWIYVDFQGLPLTAAALKTSHDATMVHLMPFALEIVIDQRKLAGFLQDIAKSPVPIDVRQVRINPTASTEMNTGPSVTADPSSRRRPFDIAVELRGTVGLATPPNEAVLGAAPATEATGGVE